MRPALVLCCVALATVLGACASGGTRQVERRIDSGEDLPTPDPTRDRQVHLDLIQRMLDQDQNYAALAHIETLQRKGNDTQLRLLEADTRRKLGQYPQAQQLYTALLNTSYSAQAYHGLGLIAARSNPTVSLDYLQRAVRLMPTNVEMRNDLGYALMLARRYPDALPQLATAVELEPGNGKSRNNLLILMMLMRDEASVQRIVRESRIDAATLADLRKRASSMAAAAAPRPAVQPPQAAAAKKAS